MTERLCDADHGRGRERISIHVYISRYIRVSPKIGEPLLLSQISL